MQWYLIVNRHQDEPSNAIAHRFQIMLICIKASINDNSVQHLEVLVIRSPKTSEHV
jgi:hypothetical protein